MGIKAASIVTPYEAGTANFTPTNAPSVPVGYTRYPTNIATANIASTTSIFYGIAVEDEMTIDVDSSITVIMNGGYATGFLLVDSPITTTIYYYYPSNEDYLSEVFSLVDPTGRSSNKFAQSVTSPISSRISSPIQTKITL